MYAVLRTPEEIVSIEKVDPSSPTAQRHALRIPFGEDASTENSISGVLQTVNRGEQVQESGPNEVSERERFIAGLNEGTEPMKQDGNNVSKESEQEGTVDGAITQTQHEPQTEREERGKVSEETEPTETDDLTRVGDQEAKQDDEAERVKFLAGLYDGTVRETEQKPGETAQDVRMEQGENGAKNASNRRIHLNQTVVHPIMNSRAARGRIWLLTKRFQQPMVNGRAEKGKRRELLLCSTPMRTGNRHKPLRKHKENDRKNKNGDLPVLIKNGLITLRHRQTQRCNLKANGESRIVF